jgi:hypothetical protein
VLRAAERKGSNERIPAAWNVSSLKRTHAPKPLKRPIRNGVQDLLR